MMKFKIREEAQKDLEEKREAPDAYNKHSDKHGEFSEAIEAHPRKCDGVRPQRLRKRHGIYQVTPEGAAHMREAYFYILEMPRRSTIDGYMWLCARFYSISDESGEKYVLGRGQRPSLRQFRDYLRKKCLPDKRLIKSGPACKRRLQGKNVRLERPGEKGANPVSARVVRPASGFAQKTE